MRCLDTVSRLRARLQELNRDAAIADAVSNAQKEFTRYVVLLLVCVTCGCAFCCHQTATSSRYIFHEVRGPLNNFSLGLEALADLPSVKESEDAREIVSEKRKLLYLVLVSTPEYLRSIEGFHSKRVLAHRPPHHGRRAIHRPG